ncbi:MAG: Trk system potassium transporter TrkA [Clostridia bacterium]|nr:Trk system potassium transporter TrkA [Clostridia bacterium]
MNIIITGNGKVGKTLTRQLSGEGHNITVIDKDSSVLESSIENYDVLTVTGNCASRKVLDAAEIEKTDVVIATAATDETNLLCCLSARSANPDVKTIARIRTPDYVDNIERDRDLYGLSLAINLEKNAAIEMDRLIKFPGVLKRETFIRGRVEIVELAINEDSPLCDEPLTKISSILRSQVLVCCVLRDGEAIIPGGSFVLRHGDRIFVTGAIEALSKGLRTLGVVTGKIKKVFIVGGGRVSFYLAHRLVRNGLDVTIVEKKRERCEELSQIIPEACIICGDASDMTVLESERMGSFDAVASLTGIDELNIITSIFATKLGVKNVITKIGRDENRKVVDSLPVGSIVCPKELCCSAIVRYIRGMQAGSGAADSVHFLAEGLVEASEFTIDETTRHRDTPLRKIKLKKNTLVACVRHNGKFVVPDGDSCFSLNDKVIIVSKSSDAVLGFNDIFAD